MVQHPKDTIDDETILRSVRPRPRLDCGSEDGHFVNTGAVRTGGVPPEVLFLERAWHWAKPGIGRIAILLPDGLLGNPGDEYVRWWILRHCEVLASVDLPVEPFKVTLKDYIADTSATEPPGATAPERRRADARVDHP